MRRSASVAAVVLAAMTIAAAALWLAAPGAIDAAYHGRSIGILNGLISGQQRHSVADYVMLFRRTLVSGWASAAVVLLLVVTARSIGRRIQALSRRERAAAVIVLILVVAAGRLFTFGEAYERDITAYAVISEEMLHGKSLYTDVWDHKPPAIHLSYAAVQAVFGATPLAIWVLGWSVAALTLVGCYRAARQAGGYTAGLAAAAFWALINADLLLQANQPNTEVFMNACLVWGFVAFTDPRGGMLRAGASGALFFLASLYKPVVAVVAVAVVGAHLLLALRREPTPQDPGEREPGGVTPGVVRAAVAAGVAGTLWAAVCAFYLLRGTWAPFVEATVAYNRDYAGSVTSNLLASLDPGSHPLWATVPYLFLAGILGVLLLGLVAGRESRRWALRLLAYFGGAWVAVVMPGRLYPHYYQLLLPPLAIAFGWLAARAIERRSAALAAALSVGLFGIVAARTYQMMVPAREVPIFKYGAHGVESIEAQQMGPWIAAHVPASAVLYHWGAEPGVYFWSARRSPVPFTYNLPLVDSSERARRYTADTLATLQQHPPDVIVAKRLDLNRAGHPITEWIRTQYEEIPGPAGITQYVFLTPRAAAPMLSHRVRQDRS
jgi:4-amino-4-deoxy-L-arabinose transferase-like glycosyltransferase